MEIVCSFHETARGMALRELAETFASAPRLLGPGVALLSVDRPFEEIGLLFREAPLLFTQHIFPAQWIRKREADLPMGEVIAAMDKNLTYSVQARAAQGNAPTRALSDPLRDAGFVLDIKRPAQIVSVYCGEGLCCMGLSRAEQNLNDWNGGMVHFSAAGLINRAECKLLEAAHVFALPLLAGQRALDLGAAPGGWSKVLLERGLHVTAVDPAALDARLRGRAGLAHVADTAQSFLRHDTARYDWIFNDMKMDAFMALDLLLDAMERLEPGGHVLSTFKLPKKGGLQVARAVVDTLREKAHLHAARQLFHNRSEFTALFTRRG